MREWSREKMGGAGAARGRSGVSTARAAATRLDRVPRPPCLQTTASVSECVPPRLYSLMSH